MWKHHIRIKLKPTERNDTSMARFIATLLLLAASAVSAQPKNEMIMYWTCLKPTGERYWDATACDKGDASALIAYEQKAGTESEFEFGPIIGGTPTSEQKKSVFVEGYRALFTLSALANKRRAERGLPPKNFLQDFGKGNAVPCPDGSMVYGYCHLAPNGSYYGSK
jgi:hypothetical protein